MRDAAVGSTLVVGLALAIWVESLAYDWDEPLLWAGDLAVTVCWLGLGLTFWRRGEGAAAALSLAMCIAWVAGTVLPVALYWHRAVLVHLFLAAPRWLPRGPTARAAVLLAYLAWATPAPWRSDWLALGAAAAVVLVVLSARQGALGAERRAARAALGAALIVAFALAVGVYIRSALPPGTGAVPALVAYESGLIAAALLLWRGLPRREPRPITDLVVELGGPARDSLRDALAQLLGDPELEIGFWSPQAAAYLDADGRPLAPPRGRHRMTAGAHSGQGFALFVHDRVMEDPALIAAVTTAARLYTERDALLGRIQDQVDQLARSRRRLVIAADEERERLEQRIREGPERRLHELQQRLDRIPDNEHGARAAEHAGRAIEDLRDLALGLHPRLLTGGIRPALQQVVETCPLPIRIRVGPGRWAPAVEATTYFVCAEAINNITKHAYATKGQIDVHEDGARLVVSVADDGVGGAHLEGGTGLFGLRDRVESLGGQLTIESNEGGGTRLVASIPLGPGS